MPVLLDTHVLLWWFTDDDRMSTQARDVIADEANDVYVSAVSAWEIATKERLGKLAGVPQATERFTELVAADGFRQLPISHLHSLRAGGYTVAHRDPFDRMLAAQSDLDKLPLVTRDPAFAHFGIETLW